MPATNYTPIQLYRTNTASTTAPSGANLNAGELAINYNDSGMILYAKNTSGTVIKLMNNPANLLYPTTDGSANQVIKTNGSGVLSFATVSTSPGGSTTQVQYNNAGSFGGITNATTDGTTLLMTSPKIITAINDTNANELIKFTATGSAVNEITVANAATTANPVISATGGDTNIGVTVTPKGTGNLVLTTGNVVVANGNGIDFSATAGTGTSELFNDYEEGTWTPTLASGGTSVTYTTQYGSYTKIGRLVTIQLYLKINTATAAASDLQIGGLPFTSSVNTLAFGGAFVNYQSSFNTNAGDTYHIGAGGTIISVLTNTAGYRAGNAANVTLTGGVALSGQYIAA